MKGAGVMSSKKEHWFLSILRSGRVVGWKPRGVASCVAFSISSHSESKVRLIEYSDLFSSSTSSIGLFGFLYRSDFNPIIFIQLFLYRLVIHVIQLTIHSQFFLKTLLRRSRIDFEHIPELPFLLPWYRFIQGPELALVNLTSPPIFDLNLRTEKAVKMSREPISRLDFHDNLSEGFCT